MSRFALVSLLVGLAALSPCAVSSQELQFFFNPPTGRPLIESLKKTRVESGPGQPASREVFELQMQVVSRRTGVGYTLVRTPLLLHRSYNGKRVQAVPGALTGVVLTDELDVNGQLLALHGYERLAKYSGRAAGAADFSAQAVSHWNSRIGHFAGRSIQLGEVTITSQTYELSAGQSARFYTAIKYGDLVPCGLRRCLQMQFSCNSNTSALGLSISALPEAGYREAAHLQPAAGGIEIAGSGHRLIDPDTMLIYSESAQRSIRTWTQRPGRAKVWKTTLEELEYSWR